MGKYMRKRTGRAPAAAEVAQVVVGVRTRSRSAAAAAFASAAVEPPAPAPKRPRTKQAAARGEVEVRGDGGGCYLQLRSRRLFMAVKAAEARRPVAPEGNAAARSGEASLLEPVVMVAGISRCSSTASSVDVVAAAAALERSGGAMEVGAREDRDGESAVSDSECGGRQRREATPSSRLPVDLSDEESSQAAGDPKHHRLTATASLACRARMPAEEEIDEFFAAAEKAEAERFAAK
nr:unnamed protein product [Digitaria exilis]